ncbi:MAG TPA: pyruvate kinase [Phycisphaerae bacterium]|nr:pyruvate kinase [Phycisphaerae bacterium]HOJ54292.1 pyruvate kinase [Phycisphaerae bacterium]HOL26763.1 pyruvate kinase [Phycisphaerae bacterium]HPP20649.1 pyruvate kinase [Phycisphaerae bacterium]HPU33514.1 pyruvate kinase [Phycisphaerae bacterium]
MSTACYIQRPSKTKIVATVGPACQAHERLLALIRAGVDVFRINTAHGKPADFQARFDSIRKAGAEVGVPIAILVDLAGPKMRLGELVGGELELHVGEKVRFVRGNVSTSPTDLTTTYAPLIDELRVGDRVMLADGTVMLTVEEKTPDAAVCRVVQGGTLRSRQGVNLPGVKLSVPTLGEHDKANARWAATAGADFISLSFVRSANDVRELKALLDEMGSTAQVVAKIEKPEAVAELDAVVEAADAVMVARGDLGVEIDIAEVPMVQKRIIRACRQHRKPVIVATQMLDSMQHSRLPTRAETADVANAILDGADACMLSGETAIGQYPVESVEMMGRIALATEALMRDRREPEEMVARATSGADPTAHRAVTHTEAGKMPATRTGEAARSDGESFARDVDAITDAMAHCAGHLAEIIDARLMVVFTHSGATARCLSQGRHFVPTIGVSDSEVTLRRMCLYWGVMPLAGARKDSPEELLKSVRSEMQRAGCPLTAGDKVVLIGRSGGDDGRHNMVMVQEVE